jgi:spore cortex biosynthesis protein YabQ
MNKAISVELQFFLISILWGSILLLVYDCLRILRRIVKHNGFFVALEDLIFWVVSSVFIFAMIYKENDGIIRGFSVMGMGIGMVLYHFILSELLVEAVTKLIHTLLRPFAFILKQIRRMLRFILSGFKKQAGFLLLRLKRLAKSVKIILHNRKVKRQLKREIKRKKRSEETAARAKKKAGVPKKKENQKNTVGLKNNRTAQEGIISGKVNRSSNR